MQTEFLGRDILRKYCLGTFNNMKTQYLKKGISGRPRKGSLNNVRRWEGKIGARRNKPQEHMGWQDLLLVTIIFSILPPQPTTHYLGTVLVP